MRHIVLVIAAWAASTIAPGGSPATAAEGEPQFLGRTRGEWVAALEAGARRDRGHAAWALSLFALEQAGPTNTMLWLNELCLLAENESPVVRYWGAVGIGRFLTKVESNPAARDTALAALTELLKDRAASPRLAAAEALCLAGQTERALPILEKELSNPQEAVRIQAVAGLAKLGSTAAPVKSTLQRATSDESEYVKRLANRALVQLEAHR